jgi:membrane protein DedA with SNARE-associated domain
MTPEVATRLLVEYRYWILIPLTFLEGPVVAFAAGTLASLGYFKLYELAVLFLVRDLLADTAYYCAGYFGRRSRAVRKALAWLKIEDANLDRIRERLLKHPIQTIFIGKLSYGVASTIIVGFGVIRMRYLTFMAYGVWVTVLQYGTLLALGFYYGVSLGARITSILDALEYLAAAVAVAAAVYYLFGRSVRDRLFKK